MTKSEKDLLKEIYDHKQSGNPEKFIVEFCYNPKSGKPDKGDQYYTQRLEDVEYLEESGYIKSGSESCDWSCVKLTEKGELFVENDFQQPTVQPSVNFNFANATIQNSAIGQVSGNKFVFNAGATLQELRSEIQTKPAVDQEQLQELVTALESLKEGDQPLERGAFARFSDVLTKYSDLFNTVGKFFCGLLGIHD